MKFKIRKIRNEENARRIIRFFSLPIKIIAALIDEVLMIAIYEIRLSPEKFLISKWTFVLSSIILVNFFILACLYFNKKFIQTLKIIALILVDPFVVFGYCFGVVFWIQFIVELCHHFDLILGFFGLIAGSSSFILLSILDLKTFQIFEEIITSFYLDRKFSFRCLCKLLSFAFFGRAFLIFGNILIMSQLVSGKISNLRDPVEFTSCVILLGLFFLLIFAYFYFVIKNRKKVLEKRLDVLRGKVSALEEDIKNRWKSFE